jgi:small subunit ribosomal protein S18
MKEKKNILSLKKGKKVRINWKQSLRTISLKGRPPKRVKKSLQYLLLLKKFHQQIDYKNVKLLKAFLTKFGKIRSRKKTRISLQKQRKIARAIRKARAFQLLPFTCDVIL